MKSAAIRIEGLSDRVFLLVSKGFTDLTGAEAPPGRTVKLIRNAVGVEPNDQAHLTGWACGVLAAMRDGDLPYPEDLGEAPQPLDALWAAISGKARSPAAQSRAARCGQAWRLGIRVGSIESGTKIMRAIEQQAERTGESEQVIADRVVKAQSNLDTHIPERRLVPTLLDAVSPGAGGSESKRINRVDISAKVRRQVQAADPEIAALTIADVEQQFILASRIMDIMERQDFERFVRYVRTRYRNADRTH